MPSSEIIEEVPNNGAPIRLTDNTDKINAVLLAWNQANEWPGIGAGDSAGTAADDSSGDGGAAEGGTEGCGCSADPQGSALWSMAGLLGLVALRRRRD